MMRSNKKRIRRGQPPHYKMIQWNNSAIPYAYYCEALKEYLVKGESRIATQKAMQTFWQRWISKKTWDMSFYEKVEHCTDGLEPGRELTDAEIRKAS